MKSIGIIDARAGSRRMRRCKVQPLLGTPCIGWVIRAAAASRLNRLVVATDDDEIARFASAFGVESPIRLPAESMPEDLQSAEVTQYVLKWLKEKERVTFEVAVTLRRTTPFLSDENINICLGCMGDRDVASAITVTRSDQPLHNVFVMRNDLIGARAFDPPFPISFLPQIPSYMYNGCVCATKVTEIEKQDTIFARPLRLVPTSDDLAMELREPWHWVLAEAIGSYWGLEPAPENNS